MSLSHSTTPQDLREDLKFLQLYINGDVSVKKLVDLFEKSSQKQFIPKSAQVNWLKALCCVQAVMLKHSGLTMTCRHFCAEKLDKNDVSTLIERIRIINKTIKPLHVSISLFLMLIYFNSRYG